jgi:SAM-dependent methyltransferase
MSRDRKSAGLLEWVEASLDELNPFFGKFDFVWCAQSLFSFPDPISSLEIMKKLLKPHGMLGILENDTLHQLCLPWPVELELQLRSLEFEAFQSLESHPSKFYVGRRLPYLLDQSGFETLRVSTQAIDRRGPINGELASFLRAHLNETLERLKGFTSQNFIQVVRAELESLMASPQFSMTWSNILTLGQPR